MFWSKPMSFPWFYQKSKVPLYNCLMYEVASVPFAAMKSRVSGVISIRLIVGGLLSNLWKVHVFTILKNGTNTIARVFYLVVRCSRARFQDVCWNQIPKDGGRPHLHGRPSSSWDPKFGATTNRRKETGSATKLRSNSSEHCTYERMAKSTCPLQNYV